MSEKVAGSVKEISATSNPIIKNIKGLALKKHRDQEKLFLAEGLKLVLDAFEAGWTIHYLLCTKTDLNNPRIERIAATARAYGAMIIPTNTKVLSHITRRDNPQNVIGVFKQKFYPLHTLQAIDKTALFIGLDRVRDPGNLGTIIRTADAIGAAGVLLIDETTDPFSFEAVRATMGSLFTVPLYRIKSSDFSNFAQNFQQKFSGRIIGTHLKGAIDYRSVEYKNSPLLLLMGNEQKGLSELLAAQCQHLVRIPQIGQADSLNLAVATGIVLYEMRRHLLTL